MAVARDTMEWEAAIAARRVLPQLSRAESKAAVRAVLAAIEASGWQMVVFSGAGTALGTGTGVVEPGNSTPP